MCAEVADFSSKGNSTSENRNVGESVTVKTPYPNLIVNFNNPKKYPDVNFVIPGIEAPFRLHRPTLADASTALESMFDAKQSMFGAFDENARRAEWTDEKAASDATYRNVLVKWLRFCYGEDQTFSPDECVAAIIVSMQLGIKCNDGVLKAIKTFMSE